MIIFLVSIVCLLFWPTHRYEFVYDDYLSIETNTALREPNILQYTTHPETAWASQVKDAGGIYRPFGIWISAQELSLLGMHPGRWHIVSMGVHILNTVLFFFFVSLLVRKASMACIAALIFALHPAGTEAILWITQQTTLWATSLTLVALILFTKSLAGKQPWLYISGATIASFLAICTKEQAIIIPLLAAVISWQQRPTRIAWRGIISLSVSSSVYLMLRILYLGSFSQTETPWGGSYGSAILTMIRGVTHYIKISLLPYHLTVNYDSFGTSYAISDSGVLISGTAIMAILWYMWRLWRTEHTAKYAPLQLLGISWFFIALIPVHNVFNPLREIINERFLYIALPGLALAVTAAGYSIFDTYFMQKARAVQLGFIGTTFLILLSLAYQSHTRIKDWQNEEHLWRAALRVHPNDVRNHHNLAVALEKQNSSDEALREYQIALDLAQGNSMEKREIITLGWAYLRARQPDKAISTIAQIYPNLPDNDEAAFVYGNALLDKQAYQEAASAFMLLTARTPKDNEYVLYAVLAATLAGDTKIYERALLLRSPAEMQALFVPLSEARKKILAGQTKDGIALTTQVLRKYPAPSPFVLIWLGEAFEHIKDQASAATLYKIAYASPFTAISALQGLHRLQIPLYTSASAGDSPAP
ncbi:MAG: hypothetical protein A2756_03820 [Candidatus Ryanbacteria bacterium RIFCSPHIGHO2_01_FULL_48_27]|uniref:Uncharacterized protein n=1 Tax=Candidatus Ryanbacteria bacterium RIFCSPHIGHO2_01_FULL_48_27 TaxID=1802115 RepID=A0A1G2G3Z7_9BACT|nr:MAG: hypothetical protein A2756_03820 [Candidatus Ryanbacteria bacterium RIFCSPHIGHO2_01_FULL_48_27]